MHFENSCDGPHGPSISPLLTPIKVRVTHYFGRCGPTVSEIAGKQRKRYRQWLRVPGPLVRVVGNAEFSWDRMDVGGS